MLYCNRTVLSETRKCKLDLKKQQHFISHTGFTDAFHLGSGAEIELRTGRTTLMFAHVNITRF